MGYTTLDIGIPSPMSIGVGVLPGTGVGVIVGVGVGAAATKGVGVGADATTGVGVGTDVAVGTGIAAPFSKVINAVIDHDCPLAKIVPVLPLSELTPPNITVDPATVGNAVTVMVEPWSYLPIASGAGLKANNPF